ncbi:Type III secretion needle MxiH like protein [Labrenzia sp. THAF82]|uniref:type III secretion system inner rod subunit SctI n=1 Tax=Labrenzia sp. THAF82 TaxID=2587861 RepID=UPI0012A7B483|nr:type III secretion system inner rod subunit SctI [Labrenzia sp. THAF82]QFT33945.1 Type III secretion needle MxiH like protein [Labrenzia sp. THAF82]
MISNDDVASFSMQMQAAQNGSIADASGAAAASVSRFEGAMKVAQSDSSPEANVDALDRPSRVSEVPDTDTAPSRQGPVVDSRIGEGETLAGGETYGDLSVEAAAARAAVLEVGQVSAAGEVDDNKGDVILDGLSRLRSAFDGQADRVVDASSSSVSGTEKLIDAQMEIVKYSLLMDVTSKLVGKSTQTFDTLMKGQ